jgi:hypothetical protein
LKIFLSEKFSSRPYPSLTGNQIKTNISFVKEGKMISDRIIMAFAGFLILRVCSHPQTPPLSASLSGFCRPPLCQPAFTGFCHQDIILKALRIGRKIVSGRPPGNFHILISLKRSKIIRGIRRAK